MRTASRSSAPGINIDADLMGAENDLGHQCAFTAPVSARMLSRPVEVLKPQAGEMMLTPSRTRRSVLRATFPGSPNSRSDGAHIAHGVDGGEIFLEPLQIDERIDADGIGVNFGQLIAAAAHVAANVHDDLFAVRVNGVA